MQRFIMAFLFCLFVPQVAGVSQFSDQTIAYRNAKLAIRYVTVKKIVHQWVYGGKAEVTAYCKNCTVCGTTHKTADGTYADYKKRIVAADPAVPFGTTMKIDGFDEIYTVRDRGGKIKGNCIDVLMSSHWRAKRFGRQKLDVWILRSTEVALTLEVPEGAKISGN